MRVQIAKALAEIARKLKRISFWLEEAAKDLDTTPPAPPADEVKK